MWNKIKAVLVMVGLAFVGASYLFTRYFGSGTLHVVTVGPGGVNVSVLPVRSNVNDRLLLVALSSDADALFTNLDEIVNSQE